MSWLDEIATAYDAARTRVRAADPRRRAGRLGRSLRTARDRLGCSFFDFLTAVDALEEGSPSWPTSPHLASERGRPAGARSAATGAARVECVCAVYAGAGWHERETHEMFGIDFVGHVALDTLLLPDGFEGHPLRKDFVLASRVAKSWPGAKEPGESDHEAAPSRRRTRPPGVPDPDTWPRPPLEPAETSGRAVRNQLLSRQKRPAGRSETSC